MKIIYNIVILIYSFLIRIASLFSEKAKLWCKGRKNWQHIYSQKIKPKTGERIWFHCASLGEFEQARPLIELIHSNQPYTSFIISFSSPSGYEARKNYILSEAVIYLPIDTKKNAKKLIELINPDKAFFVKYEFWYHYISELKNQNIPLFLLSGNFRANQLFFKWYGGFFRNILSKFSFLYIQNESSAQLLNSINMSNYLISGDTRIDRCEQLTHEPVSYPIIQAFTKNHFVIVAGSTWAEEEHILASYISHHSDKKIKLIIAQIENNTSCTNEFDVLILDKIGMLAQLYQYASVAFVGGGFSGQLHNILEAAAWGKPVIYGPKTHKFPEGNDLVKAGGGFKVTDAKEFELLINQFFSNNEDLQKASKASKNYILKNLGGTRKVYESVWN
ncbi:MAG: 3-deoxy-D-manno-octulosonic acid transferase [Bacteroidetes bacterium]|nr:3-deoxy-D-manno-octulosonic acid transferase [Bacteroidota bacterium]